MALPGRRSDRDPRAVARIRSWVVEEVGDAEAIVVTELACTEPGCPPIETVIGLLAEGTQQTYKIHKPLAEVESVDVIGVLRTAH